MTDLAELKRIAEETAVICPSTVPSLLARLEKAEARAAISAISSAYPTVEEIARVIYTMGPDGLWEEAEEAAEVILDMFPVKP